MSRENNLAYIDFNKCKLCTKCVAECPTGAIHAVNFPPKPPKPAVEQAAAQPIVQESQECMENKNTNNA